jgi:hypothetical protein
VTLEMGDEGTGQGATATDQGTGGQAPPAGSNGSSEPAKGPDGQPWDPDRAMRTIGAQRDELKAEKDARAEAERRLKEYEDAKLSETEKLTKERDDALAKATAAEARVAERDTTDAIMEAASSGKKFRAKAGRAAAVARLIDRNAIERDANGKPTNLESLLERARAEAPELFETTAPSGDAEGGARGGAAPESMSDRIRRGFGHGPRA